MQKHPLDLTIPVLGIFILIITLFSMGCNQPNKGISYRIMHENTDRHHLSDSLYAAKIK